MKSTGIIRRIDELGRLVIPKEIRRVYGLDTGVGVDIYTRRYGYFGETQRNVCLL